MSEAIKALQRVREFALECDTESGIKIAALVERELGDCEGSALGEAHDLEGRVEELQSMANRRLVTIGKMREELAAARADRDQARDALRVAGATSEQVVDLERQLAEERNKWQVTLSSLELAKERACEEREDAYGEQKERAEKAEAACAHFRQIVNTWSRLLPDTGWPEIDPENVGDGWASPGQWANLRERCVQAEAERDAILAFLGFLRPAVWWFARQMETKLRKRDDQPGWIGAAPWTLMERLHEESLELDSALRTDPGAEAIIEEAADVANFAMMIADNVGPGHDRHRGPLDIPGVHREPLADLIPHSTMRRAIAGDIPPDQIADIRAAGIDPREVLVPRKAANMCACGVCLAGCPCHACNLEAP